MSGLKILQVGSSMPDDWGGIERYVAYLSPALVSRGHDVIAACVPASPLSSKVGVPVVSAKVAHKYDLVGVAAFLRIFRQHRFDVVNTHFSPDYLVPAWAARLASQRGLVLTRHLVLPVRPSRVRAYTKLYEHFIGVSDAAKMKLEESGFPADRISVARAGIPRLTSKRDRSLVRSQLGIDPETVAIGMFGRIIEEKGHADLLAAVEKLDERFQAHVFGDGPLLGQLRSRAGKSAVFHGYVADVADAMTAMDVLAMPSRWEEALGIAVLEGLSVGLPIVASRMGGIPEVVRDGVNGLLVDTRDSDQFARALLSLADTDKRKHLGRGARTSFEAEFRPEHFAERTEAAYFSMLNR